jgi:hypothetical protein
LRDCGGCREGEAGGESAYKKIPVITDFTDEDGNDRMKETVQANYRRIKEEVKQIVGGTSVLRNWTRFNLIYQ